MGRGRVVVGSLLGAAAIHLVFLACGASRIEPSDGGMLDAALDAMGMLGDAETRDATAQDAQPSCNCTAPSTTTFSGGIDLGSGAVAPRAEFSSASFNVQPYRYTDGESGPLATAVASFWLSDTNLRYTVACGVYLAGAAPRAVRPSTPSNCTIVEYRNGEAAWSGSGPVTAASMPVLEDGRAELLIETAAATNAGRTITVRNLRFRLTQPAGGLVSPPRAYQP
jgi:hypothetical protein